MRGREDRCPVSDRPDHAFLTHDAAIKEALIAPTAA
jgi:hypothetical protein